MPYRGEPKAQRHNHTQVLPIPMDKGRKSHPFLRGGSQCNTFARTSDSNSGGVGEGVRTWCKSLFTCHEEKLAHFS